MNLARTPIAVFTYNRPDHARRALKALERCSHLDECEVFIYSDAPQRTGHVTGVEQTRKAIHEWANKHSARVVQRDVNLGLARSIVDGVTTLTSIYERVIVLEDDLVVSPDFIQYMLGGLERYRDDEQVMQISGFMYNVGMQSPKDAFFLPSTSTWGWAIWERAWKHFDWDASGAAELLANANWCQDFDMRGSYPYSTLLSQRLRGENDSWGVVWYYCVYQRNGLVLFPGRSLVWNGGFDGTGIHSGRRRFSQPALREFEQPRYTNQIRYPDQTAVDEVMMEATRQFLRHLQVSGKPSLSGKIKKIIRGLIPKRG
jgi:hypothetical protein